MVEMIKEKLFYTAQQNIGSIDKTVEAIEKAITEYAMEGDILLLAGKGHETYQIDAEGKHPFDERKIVTEAFEKLYS